MNPRTAVNSQIPTLNAKQHKIVQKDYYRLLKADSTSNKHFERKKYQELGRVAPKTELDKTNYKFKGAAEVISEQYARAEIPEHRLYMIEKVVRMRG